MKKNILLFTTLLVLFTTACTKMNDEVVKEDEVFETEVEKAEEVEESNDYSIGRKVFLDNEKNKVLEMINEIIEKVPEDNLRINDIFKQMGVYGTQEINLRYHVDLISETNGSQYRIQISSDFMFLIISLEGLTYEFLNGDNEEQLSLWVESVVKIGSIAYKIDKEAKNQYIEDLNKYIAKGIPYSNDPLNQETENNKERYSVDYRPPSLMSNVSDSGYHDAPLTISSYGLVEKDYSKYED